MIVSVYSIATLNLHLHRDENKKCFLAWFFYFFFLDWKYAFFCYFSSAQKSLQFNICNGAICKLRFCEIIYVYLNQRIIYYHYYHFQISIFLSVFLFFYPLNGITLFILSDTEYGWWCTVKFLKDKSVKARYLSKRLYIVFFVKPSKFVIWLFVKGWCLL